jgi:CheY-like chemotaxis protein/nitrogen-specific signal transduction histidine kinase
MNPEPSEAGGNGQSLTRIQAQLRQAQKAEAVAQLTEGVAHDFNNLLSAVIMHLGLLRRNPSLDPVTVSLLTELENDAKRGSVLIRQLLAFGRKRTMERTRLDLEALIQGMARILRRFLGEQISFLFTAASRLPEVEGDPGMLEQLVMTLCINARNAAQAGGRVVLRLEAVDFGPPLSATDPETRSGSFLKLEISGSGSGIGDPSLPGFRRPGSDAEDDVAVRLDLETVQWIVQEHHGWIDLQDEAGGGLVVSVYLPACASERPADARTQSPAVAFGRNETILLVEDEGSLRSVVALALERHGFRVLAAANAPEARRLWAAHRGSVDLLLADLVLPGGTGGAELAGMLQADKPGLKILLCSGYALSPAAARHLAVERMAVLKKPLDLPSLLQTVRQLLDAR